MTDSGTDRIRIGVLPGNDLQAAGALLARAFGDTPLNRAVLGDRTLAARVRLNQHGMRAHLPLAHQHGQVLAAWRGSALAAVLVATPPFAHPLPPPPWGARVRSWIGQGMRIASRWGRVYQQLDRHHMVEPHCYLGTLGVDPPLQGRGVGSALLRRWLVDVDAQTAPAWLETDQERNLPFYVREGFAVTEEIRVFGVPVWLMRRNARREHSQDAEPGIE